MEHSAPRNKGGASGYCKRARCARCSACQCGIVSSFPGECAAAGRSNAGYGLRTTDSQDPCQSATLMQCSMCALLRLQSAAAGQRGSLLVGCSAQRAHPESRQDFYTCPWQLPRKRHTLFFTATWPKEARVSETCKPCKPEPTRGVAQLCR